MIWRFIHKTFLFPLLERVVVGGLLLLLFPMPANAQSNKELRDSLAAATEALAFHPDSVDLRLRKAGWNLRLKQWEYACDECNFVLKLEKDNVAALFYRAYAYEQMGKIKFARLDYESALAIVPGNFNCLLGLALLNQKDMHYTEALDQMNSLCNRFPDNSIAFAARAGMEVEQKKYELAEYDYGEALRLDPGNTDYLLSRADVRIKLGRKSDARADLDELVKLGIPKPNLMELYKQTK